MLGATQVTPDGRYSLTEAILHGCPEVTRDATGRCQPPLLCLRPLLTRPDKRFEPQAIRVLVAAKADPNFAPPASPFASGVALAPLHWAAIEAWQHRGALQYECLRLPSSRPSPRPSPRPNPTPRQRRSLGML